MERLELEASPREVLGKKVRFLRRQGITPCNLYGRGIPSLSLQVDTKPFLHLLSQAGETTIIDLKVRGSERPRKVLVRGIQTDPLRGSLLHVDLYQVKMTERIRADVPLHFVEEAPAVKEKDGVLIHALNSLSIEALPDDLPRTVEVDISGLKEIDQAIHAGELPLDHGVTLLTDPEQVVIKVAAPRRAEAVVEGVKAPEEKEE